MERLECEGEAEEGIQRGRLGIAVPRRARTGVGPSPPHSSLSHSPFDFGMLMLSGKCRNSQWKTVIKAHYSTSGLRNVTKLGKVSPIRSVPSNIPRPPYVGDTSFTGHDSYGNMPVIPLLSAETLPKMRRSCQLARKVLDFAGTLVRPGITTEEIDAGVHQKIIEHQAYPSTLGYVGYPKSCCTSVNNVLVHGIPDDQSLFDGDIINVDVTVYLDGYHGDCSETFFVGKGVTESAKRLVRVARQCRDDAIALCGPGVPFNLIGHTIDRICRQHGYTSVDNLTGHGVGPVFHAQPYVFHTENDEPGVMKPGMTFTIEPVVCEGSPKYVMAADNWTLFSTDSRWSAQFEHTILITDKGHEILTL